MGPGRADRSPCGTGNSANLAALHARGKARVGDVFRSRSIIGSEFEVGLAAQATVAGKPAVIPTIAGRGFTFGLSQVRSEEHTSELQSLMRHSYAVFCLTKKKKQ